MYRDHIISFKSTIGSIFFPLRVLMGAYYFLLEAGSVHLSKNGLM